nr:putative laccase-9 [Ipomoea batatas]
MWLTMETFILQFIGFLLLGGIQLGQAELQRHTFIVKEALYTRLCSSKNILTVNGTFPGPTLYANRGDTIIIDVINQGSENITLHWHGVKQPRNPWSDGPEYITQCPIQPGTNFSQTIKLSNEEGTLWWHAHSGWSRATVHGVIIIYPANGIKYPFPKPHAEVPIILDTFTLTVDSGKTYLLRMVNSAMNFILFFSVANHQFTVVGTDGSYVKPFKSDYIAISPGQTIDLLLKADQTPNRYYMAAKAYNSVLLLPYDNSTTTAILQYSGSKYSPSDPPPPLPNLPNSNDTNASVNFTRNLRSLADENHPINVPLNVTTNLIFAVSIKALPCENGEVCAGNNGSRLAASMNNNSFVLPPIDILQAYYKMIGGVYGDEFPHFPPFPFNYTAADLPAKLLRANRATEVVVLEYGRTVEIVLQGTTLESGIDHPFHLHGYSFYVVGSGLGNFDIDRDRSNYNLVDPPLVNTIAVAKSSWTAIRFKAENPGVWFMHCHFERHTSWGMDMAFIVKDGNETNQKMLPPPPYMPKC